MSCFCIKVWYCGKTSTEINVHRLVGYVDQRDNHLPLLTVKETLEFALECMSDTKSMSPEFQAATASRVDTILRIIGLTNAADTILGDDLLRGVSGGERKRVTIAEMMMGVYRCVFFGESCWCCNHCVIVCAGHHVSSFQLNADEITTGLDSATARDVITAIRASVETLDTTALVSLLQPPPEVFNQFHRVMLMREGCIVYHGTSRTVFILLFHGEF
jgi:ABC-type multidrug transport system ATPase subunit